MKGRVKWFSREKGYGFITNSDGQDFFFGVRDIEGTKLPKNFDEVSFDSYQNKKGLAAKKIVIEKSNNNIQSNSGKVKCPKCEAIVYPKMVTKNGQPDRSFCPVCGAQIKDFVGRFSRYVLPILAFFGVS